ncbi:MAG: copper resistance protein CopD [Methylococcales bacterium]|nr:copper resistance protein CopD [Methylococcales bacterium]
MTVLPRVLKEKSPTELLRFESGFEKIGVPALIIQVITGVWLENPLSCLIMVKLGLLLLTVVFALDTRLRVIPNLTEQNLLSLAYHIIPVTLISVLFVVVGVSFR